MATPYTPVTVSGYNASPPSDDGSQTSTNEITWSKHKTKLGDPLNTAIASIDTNLQSAFALLFGNNYSTETGNYTILTTDQGKFFNVTATATITLPAAASAGAQFPVLIANNGSGTVTVDGNGAETINGAAALSLAAGQAALITCNGTAWIGTQIAGVDSSGNINGTFVGNITGNVTGSASQLNSQSASYYLDRTNHTGTQLMATISNAGSLATLSATTAGTTGPNSIEDAAVYWENVSTESSHLITASTSWTVPAGLYVYIICSANDGTLQVKNNAGSWYNALSMTTTQAASSIYSDGTNVRITAGVSGMTILYRTLA